MIQANLPLTLEGKVSGSFAVMDPMRLPLGILIGSGSIVGGTILRKGGLVTGVTTAATLWLITVIGLCLGGGQLALGCVATAIGFITIAGLKWIDVRIPRGHRAALIATGEVDLSMIDALPNLIEPLPRHLRPASGLRKPLPQIAEAIQCQPGLAHLAASYRRLKKRLKVGERTIELVRDACQLAGFPDALDRSFQNADLNHAGSSARGVDRS